MAVHPLTADLLRLLAAVETMPALPPQPKSEAQIRRECQIRRLRNRPRRPLPHRS